MRLSLPYEDMDFRIQKGMSSMSPHRYHPAICALHWLVASMIIAALVMSTFVMAHIPDTDPAKLSALLRHISVGGLVLLCTLLRLFLRPKIACPAPLPSGMPWADRLAFIVHRMLDVLVFVMVGSGIMMVVLSGLPAILLGEESGLPLNLDDLPLHALHGFAAKLLFGVLLLHAGGALYHQFVLKDGLLLRMCFKRKNKAVEPNDDCQEEDEPVLSRK